jgi:hypothetical protein
MFRNDVQHAVLFGVRLFFSDAIVTVDKAVIERVSPSCFVFEILKQLNFQVTASLLSFLKLSRDPLILISVGELSSANLLRNSWIVIRASYEFFLSSGNTFFQNTATAVILAFVPLRMIQLIDPPVWKLGFVVVSAPTGFVICSLLYPRLSCIPK